MQYGFLSYWREKKNTIIKNRTMERKGIPQFEDLQRANKKMARQEDQEEGICTRR